MDPERTERDAGDVERLLSRIEPAASRSTREDRDRLMYAAGEAAGRRAAARPNGSTVRLWQAAAAVLAVVTGGLAWRVADLGSPADDADSPLVADRPNETDDDDPAPVPPPRPIDAPDQAAEPVEETLLAAEDSPARFADPRGFLAVRHVALTRGIDALPTSTTHGPSTTPVATYGTLRRALRDADDRL